MSLIDVVILKRIKTAEEVATQVDATKLTFNETLKAIVETLPETLSEKVPEAVNLGLLSIQLKTVDDGEYTWSEKAVILPILIEYQDALDGGGCTCEDCQNGWFSTTTYARNVLNKRIKAAQKLIEEGAGAKLEVQAIALGEPTILDVFVPLTAQNATSQKAKSIVALATVWLSDVISRPGVHCLVNMEQLARCSDDRFLPLYKTFARPCPPSPEHGFVESRKISTYGDLKQVVKEALEADPKAEVLVTQHIIASHSAILTDSGTLAIGLGNDGATAGKQDTIMLPVTMTPLPGLRERAEVAKDAALFLELVLPDVGPLTVVQARSGPKIDAVLDYIPKDMLIKCVYVLDSEPDLLKWAKTVKSFNPGTAVFYKGGTLSSHMAVHCVCAGVPFITTKPPRVGYVLVRKEAPLPRFRRQEAVRGWNFAFKEITEMNVGMDRDHHLRLAFALLHNSVALQRMPEWGFIAGYMLGVLCKFGAIACVGESRHHETVKHLPNARDEVYTKMAKLDTKDLHEQLKLSYVAFQQHWHGQDTTDGCGYGGPKWRHCARRTLIAWHALYASNGTGRRARFSQGHVLAQLNIIVNLAHNGGWWLNKFTSKLWSDNAANYPAQTLAVNMVPLRKLLMEAFNG